MILSDLHVHTTFSDGANTPEETVLAAIGKGMTKIGFSDHSYTFFDESYCMKKDGIDRYIAEIKRLREKYRDKIEILCGVEQDYYSDCPTDGYDYVIGSVHYIKADGEYIPVDESAEILKSAAKNHFGGDMYALVKEYYRTVADVAERTGADVIGHFDLITKFNEGGALFDEKDGRYIAAATEAADRLIKAGVPFEINTGAVARGYRTAPYPSAEIRRYIRERGGKFVLSSDSHCADTLCFGFEKYEGAL